jgi:lysozyme family protein
MADITIALNQTLDWEGRELELVPGDSGGLTYWGIARNEQPQWPGWPLIDAYIAQSNSSLPEAQILANQDLPLAGHVTTFYKQNEWDFLKLDSASSQLIANNLYDAVTNFGPRGGVELMQKAINLCQINLIEVDGVMGPVTASLMNSIDPSILVLNFQYMRALRYIAINKPQFLKGWLRRCYNIR